MRSVETRSNVPVVPDPVSEDDLDGRVAASSAGEDPAERLAREHEELFQELRAVIPGAEVLFAFLLTVAFTERFDRLDSNQRTVYFLTFLPAGVSLVLLLAPTAFHRVRFRQADKDAMLKVANVEAITAMALMTVTVALAVWLIGSMIVSRDTARLIAVGVWLFAVVLWWGVPLRRRLADG